VPRRVVRPGATQLPAGVAHPGCGHRPVTDLHARELRHAWLRYVLVSAHPRRAGTRRHGGGGHRFDCAGRRPHGRLNYLRRCLELCVPPRQASWASSRSGACRDRRTTHLSRRPSGRC
jgi:hypothetical protein